MPTWGQTNNTGATTSAPLNSTFRLMGGTSPNTAGMVLNSVSLDLSGSGQVIRTAVYTGGTLANPTGATLVEDLGQLTINGARQFWTANSVSNPSIPQNSPLWIAVKMGGSGAIGYFSSSSIDAGDFQTVRGRSNQTGQTNGTDPTAVFPSTLDGTAAFAGFWYPWYLTYTINAGTNIRNPILFGSQFKPMIISTAGNPIIIR